MVGGPRQRGEELYGALPGAEAFLGHLSDDEEGGPTTYALEADDDAVRRLRLDAQLRGWRGVGGL